MMFQILTVTKDDILSIIQLENGHNSWTIADYQKDLDSDYSYYYKIEVDKQLVAYIAYYDAFELCQLLHIKVSDAFQNQGIGKALMLFMQEQVNDHCDTITLEVNVNNQNAIYFYESLGYLQASVRKNYYSDGSDAYLYIKELTNDGYNYISN